MIEGRKKIFIFLSIVVLFLLAFLLIYLFFKKSTPAVPLKNTVPTSTVTTAPLDTTKPVIVPVKNIPPPPPQNTEEREKLYVKQLSRTFVERFETYSNQNDNRNIVDASELSTDNMSGYIASKSQVHSVEYQGVTTRVISMDLTAFSTDAATVQVGAQIESETTTSSVASYKNGRVELKKIEGTWEVDGLFWDPA